MSEYVLTLNDKKFGIPEQKKFPMPDADHVKSAIKFFNYVTPRYEKQLARAILRRAKEFGVDLSEMNIGDNNRFKKYLPNDELKHHGILGQKWGVRRYQNEDGSYTEAGKQRRQLDYIGFANSKDTTKHWNDRHKIAREINRELNNKKLKKTTKKYQDAEDDYIHDEANLIRKYGKDHWFKKASNEELGKVYRNRAKYENEKINAKRITDSMAREFFKEHIKAQESLWNKGNPHANHWYEKQKVLDKSINLLSNDLVDEALFEYIDSTSIRNEVGDVVKRKR